MRRPMLEHGRRAGVIEHPRFPELFVEIAPFGHDDPRAPDRRDHMDRGIAGGGDDAIRRRDIQPRRIDPPEMPEVPRRRRVPLVLDRPDRQPEHVRLGPRAERERGRRRAATPAPGDHDDDLDIERQAKRNPRRVALDRVDRNPDARRIVRLCEHPRRPPRLFERRRIGCQDPQRRFIRRHMPRIVTVAVLEDAYARNRRDPGELREFGRYVGDEQCRLGGIEPRRDDRDSVRDALPAERRAMEVRGRRCVCQTGRLVADRFEQRRDRAHRDVRGKRREDVGARREEHHRTVSGQGIDDRRGALGMATPLMMDEIADRPRHAARAMAKARIPSTTPAACARRAR